MDFDQVISKTSCLSYVRAAVNVRQIHIIFTVEKITQQKLSRKITIGIQLSRIMRKPTLCICENKDADELRGS